MATQPDIDLHSEEEAFRTEVQQFLAENFPEELKGKGNALSAIEGPDEENEAERAWREAMGERGWGVPTWPKEYGGGGLHSDYQRAATRAMKKYDAPIMINANGNGWAGPLILDLGTEEQKQKYIKPMLSAEDIWCQGFSEPENGSDLGNAQLKAVKDGDEYVLNGSKIWTSLGDRAKYMILLARTDFDAPNKYAGLSFFLNPMDIDGITTSRIKKLTGEYGFVQTFFTDRKSVV